MARADLLKKLFISFKRDDKDTFYKIADEIIADERKKNHGILADDLKKIINSSYKTSQNLMSFSMKQVNSNDDFPYAEVIYPEKYFSDLIIADEKLEQLKQVIREFHNWDVLLSNGVFPSRRLLFFGPPGCGKTLAAQSIAGELGLPLLYVRFDAIISSYLGETASNIRKVFDFAKKDSWVIFFDEFDAIGHSRNDTREHGEIKRVVNAFLQQIDNYSGRSLIIAATNYEQSLDYAIWRRFDETIKFNMPSVTEKIEVFKLNLKRFMGPEYVVTEFLNQMKEFSHSDVEKVCQIIAKSCILDGRKIYGKRDVEYAVKKQCKIVSLRKTQY